MSAAKILSCFWVLVNASCMNEKRSLSFLIDTISEAEVFALYEGQSMLPFDNQTKYAPLVQYVK
jgi:hypothetical protein